MGPTDESLRAEHAAAVPLYVRAAEDGTYALVDTATDEPVSVEHPTPRAALAEAAALLEKAKNANLRLNGEPDGKWRWLDATSVADHSEPLPGSGKLHRIAERAIWEMAAGLNARESAIPINGGGAPAGYKPSAPHGDGVTGGDHPANGYAHVGAPVIDAKGRLHLYLFGELLPDIAREVDRGRLAYGSIRVGFTTTDADDDHAVGGAELISHALTNDPAVTTLTAGSERQPHPHAHVAVRTRRAGMPENRRTHHTQRGAAGDKLRELLALLGIEWSAEMEGEGWYSPASDAIAALKSAAKVEDIIAGGGSAPDVPPTELARRRVAQRMQVPGMTPEESDANHQGLIEWGRTVLGKPDASPADVLTELKAQTAPVGAALGTDTPPASANESTPPEKKEPPAEPGEQEEEEMPAPEKKKPEGEAADREAALRSELEAEKKKNRELEIAARERKQRDEDAAFLDEKIAEKKLTVNKERRERLLVVIRRAGREAVEELLADPPKAPELDHNTRGGGAAKTLQDGQLALVREAEKEVRAELAASGKRLADHQIHTSAIRRARQTNPEAFR